MMMVCLHIILSLHACIISMHFQLCNVTEPSTVGVTFDQEDYTVAEGGDAITVTGRLTGLTGQLQTAFSLTLITNENIDGLTSKT